MASQATRMEECPATEELRALRASPFAAEEFEPFVGRIIGPDVLDRVIANGWVESGWSCRPAVGKVGHRLTALGWEKFERTFY